MADYGVRITLSASSPVPTYNAGPWVNGVAKFSAATSRSGWTPGQLISVSPVGERVDIAQGGNYAEVSDFDCTVSATWWLAFQAAGASLSGALVEVGNLVYPTFLPRWSGVVSDNSWQGAELRISAESLITQRHRSIPTRIVTGQEFPGIPAESEGAVVPIVYGAVERMEGPATLSDRDYLTALSVNGPRGKYRQSAGFVAVGPGIPAPTSTVVPLAVSIAHDGFGHYFPGLGNNDAPEFFAFPLARGSQVYIEIVDGTGSGQERLITLLESGVYPAIDLVDTRILVFKATVGVAWDTAPDSTSRIRYYAQPIGASVVVGDEATVSGVQVDVDNRSYPIAFVQGELAPGIVSADVSAEFRFGEDYAAIDYQRPAEVRDIENLRDGLTASAAATRSVLPGFGLTDSVFDVGGFAEIYAPDLCVGLDGDNVDVYAFVSGFSALEMRLHLSAIRWDGSTEITDTGIDLGTSVNNYPAAVLPDGVPGAFGARPLKMTLARPIEEYEWIRLALYVDAISKPSYETFAANWVNGSSTVVIGGSSAAAVGNLVRPYKGDGTTAIDRGTVLRSGSAYGGDIRNWRIIESRVESPAGVFTCTLDAPISCATGNYDSVSAAPSEFADLSMYELGAGAVYGAIPRDSTFLVSTSAGRTYSGSPVTLARDVARDIFRRDLAVPLADTTAYASLPADACTMALVQAEDSATVLSRMCREFNWVAGHNQSGQEVATAWLSRLFSATSDYSITSSDMVAGSITGLDSTALEDLVTLPSLRWGWTQADGYRQQGAVTEVSTDPSSLTADNYLATISGFGDFSTSLDAYQILHVAWQASGLRRADDIEYRYGGDPLSLYIPARMEWAALRKDIATFRINDTHPAAAAYVGQRIAVSHKRYTAGGTGYGTLVATYWYPAEGQVQLTVMFDPAQVVITDGQLYVDTIDPTEATPLYIDQLDGVSTQYIDTLGV